MKPRGRNRLLAAAVLAIAGGAIWALWPRQPLPERLFDWTDGCIAVNHRDIDEFWRTVADGTPILIEP
jgi:hypothetical protein